MKKIYPAITLLLLMTQCVMVYVPNTRNIPLLTKKAEIQASAQKDLFGVNLQAAGAVSNHMAVMTNYSYYRNNGHTVPYQFHMNNTLFEGGVGYFRTFERENKLYTSEIFVGYGKGKGDYDVDGVHDDGPREPRVFVSGNYQRFFVQPAIGYHTPQVDFGVCLRMSFVDFHKLSFNTDVTYPKLQVYMEPSVTLKINIYKAKVYVLTSGGFNLSPQNGLGTVHRYVVAPAFTSLSTGLGLKIGGVNIARK